jgi:integrase/recombinase XerC
MAELVGLDVRGSASRVAGSTTTLARPAGQGQQAPYRASGRAALTALDAWLTARSGWGRAHDTLALFVSARGVCRCSIRLQLKQRSRAAGLATPVHPMLRRHLQPFVAVQR